MPDDVYARVGATIRSRRGDAGMTQGALAIEAGLARSSVTNIESGGQAILLHQLIELARALKVGPCDLLSDLDLDAPAGPATGPSRGDAASLLERLDRPVASPRR